MDWKLEVLFAARILFAAFLGALIGWDRERHGSDAGVRTCMAISIGACAFSLVSLHVSVGDPTRITAQIVTGIGFLGAGVILQVQGRIAGLTTAATLWAIASIGMASAFGMYVLAVLTTGLLYGMLVLHHLPGWKRFTRKHGLIDKPILASEPEPRIEPKILGFNRKNRSRTGAKSSSSRQS